MPVCRIVFTWMRFKKTLLLDVYVEVHGTISKTNGTKGIQMFYNDSQSGCSRWPVVRIRGGSSSEVIILSSAPFAITTHWDGTTQPCCGAGCRLCEHVPTRGLFYFPVMCNSRVSILELANQSFAYFEQHCRLLHGGLRPGLVVLLKRKSDKAPLHSEVLRFQDQAKEVGLLETAAHVMALFKYPGPNPGDTLESYEARCVHVGRARCERAAERLLQTRERVR